ncbi:MAG: hypothetical protein HY720_02195 [Planctomycetes bacterium]|nr:hypothetical protein [Planctomycetota bacterium]
MGSEKRIAKIKIRCRCGKKVKIPTEFAGQVGRCPECGRQMKVPTMEELWRIKAEVEKAQTARMSAAAGEEPAEGEIQLTEIQLDEVAPPAPGAGEKPVPEAAEEPAREPEEMPPPSEPAERFLEEPYEEPEPMFLSPPELRSEPEGALPLPLELLSEPEAMFPSPPELASEPSFEPPPPPPEPVELPPPPPPEPVETPEEIATRLLSEARQAHERGDHGEACAKLDLALEHDPGTGPALFLRGEVRFALGRTDDGLADLAGAILAGHRRDEARARRLAVFREQGRREDLLDELARAAAEDGGSREEILRERVRVLARMGDRERLREALDRLLDASPTALARNLRGTFFASWGEADRAAGEFREAMRLDPRFAEGHLNLANLDLAGRRYKEAILGYQRFLAIVPGDRQALANLGVCYRDKRPAEHRKAIECFERARRGR